MRADWPLVKLEDVAEINPAGDLVPDIDGRLAYFDLTSVEGPDALGAPSMVETHQRPSRAQRPVRQGDILVSTVRPYLQGFARISHPISHAVASTGFAVVRPSPRVNGDFLYQHILSRRFLDFLLPRQVGSNYPAVNTGDVGAYMLQLPPLAEQARIGAVLDAVRRVAARSQATVRHLRTIRGAILSRWWEHYAAETSVLGDHLAMVQYGPRYPADKYTHEGAIATIRTTDLDDDGNLNTATMPLADLDPAEFRSFLLDPGDVVVTRSGTCGIAALFSGHHRPTLPGAFLIRLKTKTSLDPHYLTAMLNSPQGRDLTRRVSAGGVQKNINTDGLSGLRIPVPPLGEQLGLVRLTSALQNSERASSYLVDGARLVRNGLHDELLHAANAGGQT